MEELIGASLLHVTLLRSSVTESGDSFLSPFPSSLCVFAPAKDITTGRVCYEESQHSDLRGGELITDLLFIL